MNVAQDKRFLYCPLSSNFPTPRKQNPNEKNNLIPVKTIFNNTEQKQSRNNGLFTKYTVFPSWHIISYMRKNNEDIIFVKKRKDMKDFSKDIINIMFKFWENVKSFVRTNHTRSLSVCDYKR